LAVPTGATPAGIVMYGHGTGGNYRSAESEAVGSGTLADKLADQGLIVFGWDQIMNGARKGGSAESADLLYFNVGNPQATRDNGLQAVSDAIVSEKTIAALGASGTYGSGVDAAAVTAMSGVSGIFKTPLPIAYLGHSQGAVNAVPFGAIDATIPTMVLS